MASELIWMPPHGVVQRYIGIVTGQDLLDTTAKVGGNPAFDQLHHIIKDFSDCLEFSVSEEDLEEVSAIHSAASATNPDIRVAFVACSAPVIAAVEAYAHSPLNVYPSQVFTTLTAAKNWLEWRLP